jgi:uncharacterized repeat protein (TIGR03806 family)
MKMGKLDWRATACAVLVAGVFGTGCQSKESNPSTETSPVVEEAATGIYPYRKLSTYDFFEGELKLLKPRKKIVPFQPASSLFTDYALKSRFVLIPEAEKAKITDAEIEFPVGSILIKNFYYPDDFRKPAGEKRIIETRLLIREENGWQGYPYVWNTEQTEAHLKVVGAETEVKFIDESGKDQVINYIVPNKNQCKSCHNQSEVLTPIGAKIQHLNNEFDYITVKENQLEHWMEAGILEGFNGADFYPSMIDYEDQSQALGARAMAYLDINCSHCHNESGPASTSGLFLTFDENDPLKIGIHKTPVAAGKGAGSFKFDIVPGKPDESILIYRMNSNEIGVAMPELGRTTIHREGVELIREWISSLK